MSTKNKHKSRSRKTKREIAFKSDDKANHPMYFEDLYLKRRMK